MESWLFPVVSFHATCLVISPARMNILTLFSPPFIFLFGSLTNEKCLETCLNNSLTHVVMDGERWWVEKQTVYASIYMITTTSPNTCIYRPDTTFWVPLWRTSRRIYVKFCTKIFLYFLQPSYCFSYKGHPFMYAGTISFVQEMDCPCSSCLCLNKTFRMSLQRKCHVGNELAQYSCWKKVIIQAVSSRLKHVPSKGTADYRKILTSGNDQANKNTSH